MNELDPTTDMRVTGLAGPYEILDTSTVPAYVRSRPQLSSLLADGSELSVREVGDGNLNLVFIVRADPNLPGIVVKQSLPWVRVHGESWPLTPMRAVAEALAYERYSTYAQDFVPRYFGFDRARFALAMEDLGDLRVWRGALNDGEIHVGAGEAMGRFVATVAFHSSEFGLASQTKKEEVARTVNPELCELTEDLVLTEPFTEHEHNWNHPSVNELVHSIRQDPRVHDEISRLKHAFMTQAQALIHGDLHTGSVMVGGGRTVAIDPEFAFYGPIAFDLGALWANFLIAAVRGAVLDRERSFEQHVNSLLRESWQAFKSEFRRLWPGRIDTSFTDGFRDQFLLDVWHDALGFAGAKATRRMAGYAHVSDIETLPDPQRSRAIAVVLRVARRWIVDRHRLATPVDAWAVVHEETRRPTE